jgi:hypothetical protein
MELFHTCILLHSKQTTHLGGTNSHVLISFQSIYT